MGFGGVLTQYKTSLGVSNLTLLSTLRGGGWEGVLTHNKTFLGASNLTLLSQLWGVVGGVFRGSWGPELGGSQILDFPVQLQLAVAFMDAGRGIQGCWEGYSEMLGRVFNGISVAEKDIRYFRAFKTVWVSHASATRNLNQIAFLYIYILEGEIEGKK